MDENEEATYLGPDESYSFVWRGEQFSFSKGVALPVSSEVAGLLKDLNPRGLSVERARDYGAQVFKFKPRGTVKEGGGPK